MKVAWRNSGDARKVPGAVTATPAKPLVLYVEDDADTFLEEDEEEEGDLDFDVGGGDER